MCDTRIVDLTRRCKPLVFAFYTIVIDGRNICLSLAADQPIIREWHGNAELDETAVTVTTVFTAVTVKYFGINVETFKNEGNTVWMEQTHGRYPRKGNIV